MLLRVLGTAAGGGIPQWNCACPECTGARVHPPLRRRHAALALLTDDGCHLVNATPDIADQIESAPELLPAPGTRATPLRGVLLTDAELDHTLGIARLRETDRLTVLATAPVHRALGEGLRLPDVLAPYAAVDWRELGTESMPVHPGAEVEVRAVPLSGKRPRYAAALPAGPNDGAWTVALSFTDRGSGRSLLYAPALAAWPAAFDEALATADVVLVDGTFWDDAEPRRTGVSSRTSTEMGHLPVTGPHGTAERLAALPARCLYTHLNNTNPMADPTGPECRELAALGLEVAAEGMVIEL
ncbi:MBL fold metallo-hydrolase [Streptomyces sp. NPDC051976]|uniref:pyrroloquinoline quinone biosynthesis protein PqqB n=1 Tax=Streptomyces sp. NPDC051976 TaxID=3154947 RepID=UPI00342F9A90